MGKPNECRKLSSTIEGSFTVLKGVEMSGGGPLDGKRVILVVLPCGCMVTFEPEQARTLGAGLTMTADRLDRGIVDDKIAFNPEVDGHAG